MRLNEHRIITIRIQLVYLSETTKEDANEHTNICNIQVEWFFRWYISTYTSFNHYFVRMNFRFDTRYFFPFFLLTNERHSNTFKQQNHQLQIKTVVQLNSHFTLDPFHLWQQAFICRFLNSLEIYDMWHMLPWQCLSFFRIIDKDFIHSKIVSFRIFSL